MKIRLNADDKENAVVWVEDLTQIEELEPKTPSGGVDLPPFK